MEISLDQIQDTVWQLRSKAAQGAENQRDYLCYDGSFCSAEVSSHLLALEMIKSQMLAGALCVCEEEVSAIYYGARAYLGHSCQDPVPDYVVEDIPNRAKWVLEHPECVVYEYWADYVKAQCALLGIDLKVEVSKCLDIGLSVRAAYSKVCDDVLLKIEATEIKCDLGLDISVEELSKCKADFELSIVPLNCDLTLGAYAKAISCGISPDILVEVLKCGGSVNVSAEGAELCYPDQEISDIEADYQSCVYNNDTGNLLLSLTINLSSLVINGTEYVGGDVQISAPSNVISIGGFPYDTAWVDAMNDLCDLLGVPADISFQYPTDADVLYMTSNGIGNQSHGPFRLVLPVGATFTLVQYQSVSGEGIETSPYIHRVTELVSEISMNQGATWLDVDDQPYLHNTILCESA